MNRTGWDRSSLTLDGTLFAEIALWLIARQETGPLPLTNIFRVFAALLAIFGIINFILLILADPIARYSPVGVAPTTSLLDAIALFGVGAAIWMLGTGAVGHGGKHH